MTVNRLKNTFALVAVTAAAPTVLLFGATGTAHADCNEMPSYLGGGCWPEPAAPPPPGACLELPSYLGTGGCIPNPNYVPSFGPPPEQLGPGDPHPPLH